MSKIRYLNGFVFVRCQTFIIVRRLSRLGVYSVGHHYFC